MEAFYIALLVLAIIAFFVEGNAAPRKPLIAGVAFFVVGMAAAFVGSLPTVSVSGAAAKVLAYGCALLALFGILLAVPAASDIISKRRNVR